jgi:hypothetical protein
MDGSVTVANGTVAGNVVTCNPVTISSVSGEQTLGESCMITLTSAGVLPHDISVSVASSAANAHVGIFADARANGINAPGWDRTTPHALSTSSIVLGDVNPAEAAMPFSLYLPVVWGTNGGYGFSADVNPDVDGNFTAVQTYTIGLTSA